MKYSSLSFKIQVFAILIILIFLTGGSLIVIYTLYFKSYIIQTLYSLKLYLDASNIEKVINNGVLIFSSFVILSFITCAYILISLRRRSINDYKRIIDTFSINDDKNFTLNIKFHDEDELGNLGSKLNKLIADLRTFDEIKSKRIILENNKFKYLANNIDLPVILLDNKLKVIYYNNSLLDKFQLIDKNLVERNYKDIFVSLNKKDTHIFETNFDTLQADLLEVIDKKYEVVYKVKPFYDEKDNVYNFIMIFLSVNFAGKILREIKDEDISNINF